MDEPRDRHIDEREHRREQLSDHQPIGGQPNVHDPSHPGIGDPADPRLTMPAGRVFLIVLVALLTAAIFNSEAIVRAGEGMKPGTTRDVVLSVGRPLEAVTGFVGLHLPRKGFDMAFGQESKTASGTELETGSAAILRRKARREAKPVWRQPTPARPLEVLVTGDSEADLVGLRMADLDTDDLLDVETVARNGTALTNPGFFNWELNAEQEMTSRDPDAVVMLIGANDGFNVDVGGELFAPGTPEWETEFARRVAVVMEALTEKGERPVYWVPPPTARDETYNEIYRSQNRAVKRAAESVDGARYVDIFSTINDGEYSDQIEIDGRRVLGRQSDGIHFNREGAEVPARLVLQAMAEDYPALADGIPAQEQPNGRTTLGD
ncbi:MAG TPA: GDSL-type esterase/lipase family protein [Thermoleophilaceae bacterium]|nr:GDSL-type esterase/lipase family protein [Thermoleophilaceae bacterium]